MAGANTALIFVFFSSSSRLALSCRYHRQRQRKLEPPTSVAEGLPLDFTATANEPDAGQTLTFSVENGTSGAVPTAWTTVYVSVSDITLANITTGSWVQIAPSVEIALAGALTWDVLAIQSRSPMGWTL
jgi:hypothetical protein